MCHVCHNRRFTAAQVEADEKELSLLLVILPGCWRTLEKKKAVMTVMNQVGVMLPLY